MVIKINQNGLSENRTSGYINSHEFADVTETMSGAPGYFINNRTLFLSLLFRSCANKHMCNSCKNIHTLHFLEKYFYYEHQED